ncbi:MAG TPA: hypothetical protein VHZ25_07175 [Acidobacteriaceae bacterium]|jgi:hypothetical protein|nr:hypothetical protein [Acidobacteriaceae bacterium]
MANESFSRGLPNTLGAPPFVDLWRRRALRVGMVLAIVAVGVALLAQAFDRPSLGWDHFLRGWLTGFVGCFGLCLGGMALLMVQYLSGGKWGLIVRRPLEAMTRTWPIVILMWIPIAILGASYGKLYIWAKYRDWTGALKNGLITNDQAHAIHWKQPMLNITNFYVVSLLCFAVFALYITMLNRWSTLRDADPEPRVAYWRTRFENLSGFGVVFYSALLFILVIYWVMSLDPTWYSTIYGFQYLVGQAFMVLPLAILTLIGLSKAEPIKSTFRLVEQHDLGKLCFALVMLNIYFAFGAFIIIWSGNSPEEIPWYLDRIRGGWGVIATLDVILHWLIPFALLLSRDLKRIKSGLTLVCSIMIFAGFFDLFWLIEPNFKDAARNLHFSWGILEYLLVPGALFCFWLVYYFTELKRRPLIATNDPHLAEILEHDYVHA